MSLDGAMLTGIAALDANSQAMSIYSSNIANVNTIGYKDVTANFADVLGSMYGDYNDAGVAVNGQQNITQQGLLQTASSPTDLGIQGNGFFVVSNSASGGDQYYTRVGNFSPDADGDLVNGSGYYLMGYPVGTNGTVTPGAALGPINVSNIPGTAQATQNVTLQANLDSNATIVPLGTGAGQYQVGDMSSSTNGTTTSPPSVTPDFSQNITVYDSQGGTQPITINYVQTSADTWNYEIDYAGNANNISGPDPTNPALIGAGQITFNSNGQLTGVSNYDFGSGSYSTGSTEMNFSIPWAAGTSQNPAPATSALDQNININVGTISPTGAGSTNGLTQYNSASTQINSTVDGEAYGTVTGVTVNTNGIVTANFSNGMTQNVFQIPLATFANADGLAALSGGAYQASAASGTATIDAANTGSAGSVQSGELEASTVDLATEFTNLITAERNYSAAARIVTTADTMLTDLEQLPST
jgi:flagellar hook protein FlgE